MKEASEYLYRAECKQLGDLAKHVRNVLEGGWSEEAYHQAFVKMLDAERIPYVSKPRRTMVHRGVDVYRFEPDVIVWDKILLEFKVQPYVKELHAGHYAQVIPYLHFFNLELGVLMNFGPSRFWMRRIILQDKAWELDESYRYWEGLISAEDRLALGTIRHHIISLANHYGLGYSESIYRQLIAIELSYQAINCISDVHVSTYWDSVKISSQTTQHLLVYNKYLLHVRSYLNHPTAYDLFSTKSYLKSLGLKFGLVVNFGQHYLHFRGVTTS